MDTPRSMAKLRRATKAAARIAGEPAPSDSPTVARRSFLGASAVLAAGVAGVAAAAPAGAAPEPAGHGHPPGGHGLQTGLARLVASGYAALHGLKVGVLSNPTGITTSLDHEVDVMHASSKVDLVAVFGPEHGFRGTAQAGSSEGTSVDPRTGLTVYDLYAKTWQSMVDTFDTAGIDTMVFDIQDIGARFYTYIWTMYDAMTACAASGRKFFVLDRPNPIGGERVSGHTLKVELETGIGKAPIAQQHGMTAGELARLFATEFVPDRSGGHQLDLTVIPMKGWRRDQQGGDTGLKWVAPSPNIPTVSSAQVYVGTCYFEGTNLSQGRGTTQPFELIGAPYVDEQWTAALRAARLPGAEFRETAFVPTSAAYVGEVCRGVQTYVTDPGRFDPVRTAVTMLVALRKLYPDFAWRYDTGDSIDPYWIDKLSGSDAVRTGVDAGKSADQIVAGWQHDVAQFRAMRARYLLYR
ncbi:MAG: exo-beta-N-acetylmuramidase NamZ family protein [Jatrophihabitans sp.]